MFKYILKRILIFIPTIVIITLGTFVLSLNAPGDPVDLLLNQSGGSDSKSTDRLATEDAYIQKRAELGLDKPTFYFALSNAATSDTLHQVPKQIYRENLARLTHQYGNWPQISDNYLAKRRFDLALYDIEKDDSNAEALIKLKDYSSSILTSHKEKQMEVIQGKMKDLLASSSSLTPLVPMFQEVTSSYETMKSTASTWKNWIPSFKWYGADNQYHHWITQVLSGNLGVSYMDGRPVATKLKEGIFWTMLLSIIAMIITYIVAIPLGIYAAVNKGGRFDKISTTILFMLYSLPSFWIATLMVVFLTGGDYLDWFPTYGVGDTSNPMDVAYHLILPLICWTYASFAFLSRQMRGGMLTVIGQDFIRTAKAKGLSQKIVVMKHALRNALLPIITLFASVFPRAIGGSVILEVIFNLPGMGNLSFNAILARDYPIVFIVFMFSAILTLIGYLVADVLYAVVDPRISYGK